MKSPESNPPLTEDIQNPIVETGEQATKTPADESRRSFLKKGLAFLAGAVLTPKETFGQVAETAEKEKPVVDMVVEGQKVVLYKNDIERIQRMSDHFESEMVQDMKEHFDAEIQEAIILAFGEKLKQGLLKSLELGFEIKPPDTFHAHLLVSRAYQEALGTKYPKAKEEGQASPSKQEMMALCREVKALIFHNAEAPQREQLLNKKFLPKIYPNWTVCVDENSEAFVLKPITEPLWKLPKEGAGALPKFGGMVADYNKLKQAGLQDLAMYPDFKMFRSEPKFTTDLQFCPSEDGGVKLDPRLPSLKFFFLGYKKEATETKK